MSLGSWMNKILIDWGVDPKLANMFDETIIAVLMIGVSIGLDYLCQAIFVGGMRHYTKRAPHQWNTLLMKRRVVHHLIHILPGILVYFYYLWPLCGGRKSWSSHKNMCGVYHRRNTVYYQWFAAGDAGCVQCKGQTEESSDERLCAGSAGIIVLYRRYYYHCGAGE